MPPRQSTLFQAFTVLEFRKAAHAAPLSGRISTRNRRTPRLRRGPSTGFERSAPGLELFRGPGTTIARASHNRTIFRSTRDI